MTTLKGGIGKLNMKTAKIFKQNDQMYLEITDNEKAGDWSIVIMEDEIRPIQIACNKWIDEHK